MSLLALNDLGVLGGVVELRYIFYSHDAVAGRVQFIISFADPGLAGGVDVAAQEAQKFIEI